MCPIETEGICWNRCDMFWTAFCRKFARINSYFEIEFFKYCLPDPTIFQAFTSLLLTPLFSYGDVVGPVEVFSISDLKSAMNLLYRSFESASQSLSWLLFTLHLTKKSLLEDGDNSSLDALQDPFFGFMKPSFRIWPNLFNRFSNCCWKICHGGKQVLSGPSKLPCSIPGTRYPRLLGRTIIFFFYLRSRRIAKSWQPSVPFNAAFPWQNNSRSTEYTWRIFVSIQSLPFL